MLQSEQVLKKGYFWTPAVQRPPGISLEVAASFSPSKGKETGQGKKVFYETHRSQQTNSPPRSCLSPLCSLFWTSFLRQHTSLWREH